MHKPTWFIGFVCLTLLLAFGVGQLFSDSSLPSSTDARTETTSSNMEESRDHMSDAEWRFRTGQARHWRYIMLRR
jgi:hypothetical protein